MNVETGGLHNPDKDSQLYLSLYNLIKKNIYTVSAIQNRDNTWKMIKDIRLP